MSFNSYQQPITPEMRQAIDRSVQSQLLEKSQHTVWWNPVKRQYFLANDPTSTKPDYGLAITKPGSLKGLADRKVGSSRTQEVVGGSAVNPNIGKTELDEARYKGIWTSEFENEAVVLHDRLDRRIKQYNQDGDIGKFLGGGTITSADYGTISATTIGNVMVDQQVLDLITREFVIIDAFTRRTWDKLVFTFDNRIPYLNQGGLGELDVAPSTNVAYERGSIPLKKAEGHVSVSIWASMAVLDHDVVNDTTSIIDADFPRIFNTEAASALTGFTDQAASGAYDVIAGGAFHSTTNPAVRFDNDTATIRTAGGAADTLAMNTKGYRALIQNTYMRLSGSPTLSLGQAIQRVHAFRTTHQLLPGYEIFVDELVLDNRIFVYDQRTAIFLEGPTSTRQVPMNFNQINDTVSDRWYAAGLKKATWGVEETGIHS